MTTDKESSTDPASRIAELETEIRLLQSRVQAGRINEIKLLEMQRLALGATWELNILTGELSGTVALARLLDTNSLDGSSFDSLLRLIHPEDRDGFLRDYEESRQSGKSFEQEHRLMHSDGSEHVVRHFCRTLLSREGNPVLSLGVLQDVTQTLAEARDREASFNQAKIDFASQISHEIRTPMNSIIGMSHLALKTNLPEESRQYIEKINRAGASLVAIINDILDFTKLGAGRMELMSTDFRLEDVFNHIADIMAMRAEEKNLAIRLELGPHIPCALVGDPVRLGQVLGHLIGNAIKFTDVGEILIRVEEVVRVEDQAELHISIKDTGIGISLDQLGRLFQGFVQLEHANTRRHGGTGIGLALCKSLIEQMNGRIWVESTPEKGSIFHFHARFGLQPQQPEWRVTRLENHEVGMLDFVSMPAHVPQPVETQIAKLAEPSTPPCMPVPDEAAGMLACLHELIVQSDATALDKADEISVIINHTMLEAPMATIRIALERYDYDAALSALTKLTARMGGKQ